MQLPGERAWPDSRRVGRNLRTTADAPEWSASSRPRDVGGRSNGSPSVSTRGVDSGWGGESLGDQEHEPNHHNATDKQAPPKNSLNVSGFIPRGLPRLSSFRRKPESRKTDWIRPYQVRGRLCQARNDIRYPAACGGVVLTTRS